MAQSSPGPVMFRQYDGFVALAVPELNTEGYQPFLEQYDLNWWSLLVPGQLADDFTVPAGGSWRITHVGFIGNLNADEFDYTLRFHADASGTTGTLLAARVVTVRDVQLIVGTLSFYMLELAAPLELSAGTYWLAVTLGYLPEENVALYHSWWSAVPQLANHRPMTKVADGPWIEASSSWDFAFGLYTSALVTDDVLEAFDGWAADGSLIGAGSGQSAASRMGALRNMLVEAGSLAAAGDLPGACGQLWEAYRRTDGNPQPTDFVSGPSASQLAAHILALRAGLGCQ